MPIEFPSRPALVAYVTCGDPDLATTLDIILAAIDAGAGVIELGVPFSDPVADGPAIQRARAQFADDARKLVTRLPRHTKLPIAVGFGISTAEQFAAVGEFADAGVVGSAIVETIERNPGKEAASVAQFVKQLLAGRPQTSAV